MAGHFRYRPIMTSPMPDTHVINDMSGETRPAAVRRQASSGSLARWLITWETPSPRMETP
jgi:hypothetical protein